MDLVVLRDLMSLLWHFNIDESATAKPNPYKTKSVRRSSLEATSGRYKNLKEYLKGLLESYTSLRYPGIDQDVNETSCKI